MNTKHINNIKNKKEENTNEKTKGFQNRQGPRDRKEPVKSLQLHDCSGAPRMTRERKCSENVGPIIASESQFAHIEVILLLGENDLEQEWPGLRVEERLCLRPRGYLLGGLPARRGGSELHVWCSFHH
ncbi:hypothetical protein HRI_002095300 [Hibiscus trionum]|uniref:Uncharacterized protein n=1 Tax=Hibiscus trionum TaxID=183268 RepID=A0A9W7M379_HIBTR|nr:hypothetical protein HRI_002095300 [Hibiscus trionum]